LDEIPDSQVAFITLQAIIRSHSKLPMRYQGLSLSFEISHGAADDVSTPAALCDRIYPFVTVWGSKSHDEAGCHLRHIHPCSGEQVIWIDDGPKSVEC
jgi:hypothetical protein